MEELHVFTVKTDKPKAMKPDDEVCIYWESVWSCCFSVGVGDRVGNRTNGWKEIEEETWGRRGRWGKYRKLSRIHQTSKVEDIFG